MGKAEDHTGPIANGTSRSDNSQNKIEFGGWTGAVTQILALLAVVCVAVLGCNEKQCDLRKFNIPLTFDTYFNPQSFILVLGFISLQASLVLVPYGRILVQPDTNAHFRANGIFSIIVTYAILGICTLNGFRLSSLYDQWVSIAFASYIISWAISIFLYFYASVNDDPKNRNPYSNSGNFIYDMYMGRQHNPMLFGCINVKFVMFRCCDIGCILLDTIVVMKGYEVHGEVSPTLLLCLILKAVYMIDGLWFEETIPHTFEYRHEGTGLMCVQGFLIIPFVFGMISRFVMSYNVQHSWFSLALRVGSFTCGYLIYRLSNLQKGRFRANPDDPALSHLETIPTKQGNKLIISGWWGIVKHPNYLGDIILLNSWASLAGFTHILPYLASTCSTLLLIHRIERDDQRCHEKYQRAWRDYTNRVPNYLFPGIY